MKTTKLLTIFFLGVLASSFGARAAIVYNPERVTAGVTRNVITSTPTILVDLNIWGTDSPDAQFTLSRPGPSADLLTLRQTGSSGIEFFHAPRDRRRPSALITGTRFTLGEHIFGGSAHPFVGILGDWNLGNVNGLIGRGGFIGFRGRIDGTGPLLRGWLSFEFQVGDRSIPTSSHAITITGFAYSEQESTTLEEVIRAGQIDNDGTLIPEASSTAIGMGLFALLGSAGLRHYRRKTACK